MCLLCSSFPDSRGQAETNVLGIYCLPGTGQKVYLTESCDGTLPSMGAAWGGLRQRHLFKVSEQGWRGGGLIWLSL